MNLGMVEQIQRVIDPPDTMQYIGNVPALVDTARAERSMRAIDATLDRLSLITGLSSNDIVLVVDGMRPSLYSAHELDEAETSYFGRMRHYLLQQAAQRGYGVVDMQPIFLEHYRASGDVFEFEDDGHWNETAHRIVAKAVSKTTAYKQLFHEAS